MRDWDFEGLVVKSLKMSGFMLVFFCLALVLKPQDTVVRGLVVGTAVSMWSTFFLAKRLRVVGFIPVEEAKARVAGGISVRVMSMYAILFLAVWTGWYSVCAAAAGLFVVPCLFTFNTAGMLIRESKGSCANKNIKKVNDPQMLKCKVN